MGYPFNLSILTGGTSGVTGGPVLVGDANTLSLSWSSLNTLASALTVRFSNANGLDAAIPDNSWSVSTTLTAQGFYVIEPGGRWLDVQQNASSSSGTVTVSGFVTT